MQTVKIFEDAFDNEVYKSVVEYMQRPDPVNLVINFKQIRGIVEMLYIILVKHKEMEPIESLQESEKVRIWKLTYGLDKRERIKASRGIYLVEMLSSDKNVQECDARKA